MGIADFIRTLLALPGKQETLLGAGNSRIPIKTLAFDAEAYRAEERAYAIRHFAKITNNAHILTTEYGEDFYNLFYQNDTSEFIRQRILPLLGIAGEGNVFLTQNHWAEKHPFNFPGPFYTGNSDTCGTGDREAPDNVLYDEHYCEYLFKQPQDFAQLLCVIDAANVEVLDSYSCNGNNRWTYQACKDWWKDKGQLLHLVQKPDFRKMNGSRAHLYSDYLQGDAENDLRKYCYFLEHGIYPPNDAGYLPTL